MKLLWKVINIFMCADTYTYTYTYAYAYAYTYTYWWRRERREETNRTMSQLIPSAVSLRIAETEQLIRHSE